MRPRERPSHSCDGEFLVVLGKKFVPTTLVRIKYHTPTVRCVGEVPTPTVQCLLVCSKITRLVSDSNRSTSFRAHAQQVYFVCNQWCPLFFSASLFGVSGLSDFGESVMVFTWCGDHRCLLPFLQRWVYTPFRMFSTVSL